MAQFTDERNPLVLSELTDHGQVETLLIGEADVGEEEALLDPITTAFTEVRVVPEGHPGQLQDGEVTVNVSSRRVEVLGEPASVPGTRPPKKGDNLEQSM